ncbi:CBO0543 family protein [Bacillus sp. B190/17]|uniref:CBO0543 family protein n=1 Tax=Bacillus lumedeiriae TaxID=3058829 RepID=A0ABW8I963_9BACI
MIDTIIDKFTHIYESIGKLNNEAVQLWKTEILFSWRWWVALGLLCVPWGIWLKVKPKIGWGRYLIAGLIVYVIASILDSIGIAYAMWLYPINILPYLHTFYLPWDLSIAPVSTMMFLQYFERYSVYKIAAAYSLLAAYVVEPIIVWLKLYEPLTWKHSYGVPIYFLIYLLANKVSRMKHF